MKGTSRNGYSSASSILTTWLILGLFSASGSTHLRATRRAHFKARIDGFTSSLESTTSSVLLVPTIILSHSTRFTCHEDNQNLTRYRKSCDHFSSKTKLESVNWKHWLSISNLVRRTWVVHRIPSSNCFKQENTKAVNVTPLI